MKDWRWKNQYIAHIATKPDRIFSVNQREDLPAAREWLQAKSSGYDDVAVEIGSGSGAHLIEQAAAAPRTLFVGLELRYKRVFRTVEKAEQIGVANLVVLKCDARSIGELFAPGSVRGFYVNFPEPWDKRRWKKHRLLSAEFLQNILLILRSGGFLSYKTDHGEYFDETRQTIENNPGFSVERMSRDLHGENGAGNVFTEFERLFQSQKLPVYHLIVKKFPKHQISRL